jgi:hypothetical protein
MGGGDAPQFQIERRSSTKYPQRRPVGEYRARELVDHGVGFEPIAFRSAKPDCLRNDKSTVRLGLPTICGTTTSVRRLPTIGSSTRLPVL